ncbi:hypothetical protein KUTeg_016911 [Tegillarca granosa]|uniref:Sister chromatid cohesion protein DCC1 n=1 Tax=Tegillarca granosa TaxID=220873 RepID=A0ABQ9EMA5_TEGGR|nr:hypothetical protein KUTeg_016911 [Tegillarca granosa]
MNTTSTTTISTTKIEEEKNIRKRIKSLEDINTVLEYAKLERTEVKPTIQSIFFSEDLDHEPVKVVIRGDKDEGAVLCTGSKTYDIKEAEISNSMLLVPGLVLGTDLENEGEQDIRYKQVTNTLYNYYELRPCKPKLKKLKQLLEENMFAGKECENDEHHQGKKYKFTDLVEVIQASEDEIQKALTKLEACQLSGFWRLLDFDFLTQVLNHIIQLCEENDWLTAGIPKEDCCQTLEELFPSYRSDRQIIEHVLHFYADVMKSPTHFKEGEEDEDKMEIDTLFYLLNEDKICRFFATLCLKNAGKGMVLIDRSCKPERIWYFPVEDLPEDVDER